MKTLENIVLRGEEFKNKDNPEGNLYTTRDKDDPSKDEIACTVSLVKLVLNNPLEEGEEQKPHPYTPEEMAKAIRVIEKVKEALKASQGGYTGISSIELEEDEFDLVKKFVKTYKPFYLGLNWAPFISQILG